jgi:membrane protein
MARRRLGFDVVRARVLQARTRFERSLLARVWARMLEVEFVDRSVALAGKAFVSFFPLVIVVAAFLPTGTRASVFSTLTHRLGISGEALTSTRDAFATAEETRRATGVLGLILTVFYVSSFTTALQRVYLRAWRRPAGRAIGPYVRGVAWFVAVIAYLALLGAARSVLAGGAWTPLFVLLALTAGTALWWLTAYAMLLRQVRLRVLLPVGAITGVAMGVYGLAANVWMPTNVNRNTEQFGIFGVALALVTWFSGAAICIIVGACVGPVLAEDPGPIGRLLRGRTTDAVLVPGAAADLPPPSRPARLADALSPIEDEIASNVDPPRRDRH